MQKKGLDTIGLIDLADLKYNACMGEESAIDYLADLSHECRVARELLDMITTHAHLN